MDLPLGSLLETCRRLESSWRLPEILEAVAPAIHHELGYPHTFLTLFQERPGFATIISSLASADNAVGDTQDLHRRYQSLEIPIEGDAMIQEILAHRDIVVVEDARTDPRTNKAIVEAIQNRTIINVPLILADQTVGALGLATYTDAEGVRPPLAWHLEYLRLLAGHVAVALDRVRIVELRTKVQQEKWEALVALAGQVAHELNTPLAAIRSCVGSAQEDLDRSAEAFEDAWLGASPGVRAAYRTLRAVPIDQTAEGSSRAWAEPWRRLGIPGEGDFGAILAQVRFPLDWSEGWDHLKDPRFRTLVRHRANEVEMKTLLGVIADSTEAATVAVGRLSQPAP